MRAPGSGVRTCIARLRRRSSMTAMALLAIIATSVSAAGPTALSPDPGEAIYRAGTLATGEALEGVNAAGASMRGAAAACINCHRRSGLGARDGRNLIPPITGRYLFRPRGGYPNGTDVGYVDGFHGEREPYTEATLARAIREGLDSSGKPLNPLMPRFQLGDADMAALTDYLKRMDQRTLPGVVGNTLHFATIIAPDADPTRRQAMLSVLEQYVAERNARQMTAVPRLRGAHAFMVHRRWELHVWQLTGEASTWQDQLQRFMKQQPVLAVISGLAGRTWAPVHAFCEAEAVPCLFPNVEVPDEAESDFYSMYFSRGVLLEAGLIATSIVGSAPKPVAVVHQLYRAGDVGEAAADALASRLAREGVKVTRTVLPAGESGKGLATALRGTGNATALVLWLRPADLAALGDAGGAPATVYASGLMGSSGTCSTSTRVARANPSLVSARSAGAAPGAR